MKVVCLGDSLTYGFPYDQEISWVTGLKNILGIETINVGINGDTTGGMLERFSHDVLRYNPDYIVFMGGTNDAYVEVDLTEVRANISSLIEQALLNGIIPVLALMPPVTDSSEEQLIKIRGFIKEVSEEKELSILDFYSIFLTEKGAVDEGLFADDCHPNLVGYLKMTGQAVKFFGPLI